MLDAKELIDRRQQIIGIQRAILGVFALVIRRANDLPCAHATTGNQNRHGAEDSDRGPAE